jgi:hypothetical protein
LTFLSGQPPDIADAEHSLTLRQADQARSDFAAILDELEFLKGAARATAVPRLRQSGAADGDRQCVGSDRCRRVDAGTVRAPVRVIPRASVGLIALIAVSAQAALNPNQEHRGPLCAALSLGLGDQGYEDGWHQALWPDRRADG